jgi:RNA polymerase sigma-70 factor (ECF subfamily)
MLSDDTSLLRQIASADSSALAELYDHYGRMVYSLALNLLGDAGLAEETTQDVFVQVWQKAGTYQPELGKVSTWLLSVTRHRAIDMMRRRKIRPEGSWVNIEDLLLSRSDDRLDVEPQAILHSLQQRIRRALAALPEEQRTALGLAYFQGMTQQEVADWLHEPLGTVKTRMRLGMQKLRQMLSEEEVSGEP